MLQHHYLSLFIKNKDVWTYGRKILLTETDEFIVEKEVRSADLS